MASQIATKKGLLAQEFENGKRLGWQWVDLKRQGKHDAQLENLLSSHDATVRTIKGEIAGLETDLKRLEAR